MHCLFVRAMDLTGAIEYSRKAAILAQFQAFGVIQSLPDDALSCQQRRRLTADDYLRCFVNVQAQFIAKHRHFLFISGSYYLLLSHIVFHITTHTILTAICGS